MIKLYEEVTDWKYENHTYLVDMDASKDKMIGYIRQGKSGVHLFKSPLSFNKRKRKFKIKNFDDFYTWRYY